MKTLYISDLDGTLLSPDARLSEKTIEILNILMEKGLLFSVATARSIASVKILLKDLKLSVPIILMNGVCIYDLQKREYLKVEYLSDRSRKTLLSLIAEHNLKGFAYTIRDGLLSTYYEELSSKALHDFYQERVDLYQKRFHQIDHFTSLMDDALMYFTLLDQKETLEPIYHLLEMIPDLNCVMYKDNYTPDLWYLEVYSKNASKYHALQYLRSSVKPEQIVCFGDNRNDFPLFEGSDTKIAVGNAIDELKNKADFIIGKNNEDGVAVWLRDNGQVD